jgi:hypothetical protein
MLMAAIAFPCCAASMALAFLFAADGGDHALLTASVWLTRVAQGGAVIVWATILRLWWRRGRRRRRRGCR